MDAEITYHRLKFGWLVGVALAFGIFVLVAAYSARMTDNYPDYDQQRADQRKVTLAKVQHDENALLYPTDKDGNPTATWVDQDKGLIQISIDEAMKYQLVDLKNEPVAIGAAIPGVAPAPAPTPATTNAAPAAATPPASTNAAPAVPAQPAAKTPAKPKKTKKPVKTTSDSPDQGNQPVFKTRPIQRFCWVHEGADIWVLGSLITTATNNNSQ